MNPQMGGAAPSNQNAPSMEPQMAPQDMGEAMPEQSDPMNPFDIYEKLRESVLKLHYLGLPGADKLLAAINKIQVDNVGQSGIDSGATLDQYKQGEASPTSQY
jgi:hypothetical protein